MELGVSTASLYPMLLEDCVETLLNGGVRAMEIFFNTSCELETGYVKELKRRLDFFGAHCVSAHPFTGPMEPMMLFSPYERRVSDFLNFYKKYFEAINILGGKYLVFHGTRSAPWVSGELYLERYEKLVDCGRENGVQVLQENVGYCMSHSVKFLKFMKDNLGEKAKFVFDIKQCIRGEQDVWEALDELGESILHIHVSDHSLTDKFRDCLKIGAGDFDFKRFYEKLKSFNYNGSLILELYRENYSSNKDLLDNFGFLCRLLDE